MVQDGTPGVGSGAPDAVRGDGGPGRAGLGHGLGDGQAPRWELDPAGGQVVVTRFECATTFRLLLVLALHLRTKRDVRRLATGFLGAKFLVDWRRRTVLNISLWQDLDSIYSMGEVPRHVAAAHLPHRIGVATTCGVFCFAGDWRRVMFGSGWHDPRTPLQPLNSGQLNNGRPGRQEEVDNADGH